MKIHLDFHGDFIHCVMVDRPRGLKNRWSRQNCSYMGSFYFVVEDRERVWSSYGEDFRQLYQRDKDSRQSA